MGLVYSEMRGNYSSVFVLPLDGALIIEVFVSKWYQPPTNIDLTLYVLFNLNLHNYEYTFPHQSIQSSIIFLPAENNEKSTV